MPGISLKTFNLPWHQHDQYWLSIYTANGGFSAKVLELLQKMGFQKVSDQDMALHVPRAWKATWDELHAGLSKLNALLEVEASVTPGHEPLSGRMPSDRRPMAQMQAVTESLWLGDALLEDRVICYLQPVVSAKDKVFGYESFARVRMPDNSIVAGDKIVAASKALGIEHMIDRHLHVQAIKTFVSSAFNGYLFVNFFPGFIHRPAVYLEGLSETAKAYGIVAKHIVLDFTKSETPRDLSHLKSVCEYGRSRGYSIALDDINSVEGARKLIGEIHPDFVKIDMHLARRVSEPAARESVRQIVELVHANRAMVIGEGVETEEVHQGLAHMGVDLFQGYLFSPPVPVEAVLKKGTGTA